jgi:hypothetical protein
MLSVRLDSETDEYLRKLAGQEDRKVNNMLIRIIKDYAKRNPLISESPVLQLHRDSTVHKWRLVADGVDVGLLTMSDEGMLSLDVNIKELTKE